MKETVYILGPMRGIPYFNFPAFDTQREILELQGHTAVSPADIDRNNGFNAFDLPDGWDWDTLPDWLKMKVIIKRDIDAVQQCTAYVTLDGWEKSAGARAEKALLDWMGSKWLNAPAKETVCQEAQRLTHSDRNSSYGHPLDNFGITVAMLNARFGTKFSVEDFAEIQIICKLGRQANASKRDNLVDIAGYANTHQMVIDERNRRKKI